MDASGIEEFLIKQRFTGVVDLRRGGEQLFAGAHGLASPRWGAPNTASTRFDVASISKLFTSVAVLQLVERDRLDLDASIHDYADLAGTTVSSEVTLRQLLTHRSGIADIAEEDEGENYAEVFAEYPCHRIVNTVDFVRIFAHKPANFAPGTATATRATSAVRRARPGRGFRSR